MKSRVLIILAAPVAALLLASGCGEAESSNYKSARLEGEVTVDGQPIDEGTIQFIPANTEDGPITQAAILKGRYVANKVPLGRVTAVLRATPPPPPAQVTSDYYPPETAVGIPERYSSGFPIDVKEDKADQDFPMTSKGSAPAAPKARPGGPPTKSGPPISKQRS